MPLVILDTDIGSSTDDLFALEMLFRYEEAGKCRLLGVVVDRPGEANALFADAMNTWAGRPNLPVGLLRNGADGAQVFIDYAGVADAKDGEGDLLFPRPAPRPEGRPDGWLLYRRLLAGAPDGSVTICSIGFLTCLAQLLESPPHNLSPLDGVELVRRKVARAVVMGGAFADAAEPEYNFAMDPKAVLAFVRLWPRRHDGTTMAIGNIGIGNTFTMATFFTTVGWKCCQCGTVASIQFPMRGTRTLDTGYWTLSHLCQRPFLA